MKKKRFKVGDKVRLSREVTPVPKGALGVVEAAETWFDYRVNFKEFSGLPVMDYELTPVDATPASPAVGDKVRVTFESEVVAVGPGTVTIQDALHGRKTFLHSEVEGIKPPLPTEFGSVVEVGDTGYVFDGERWISNGAGFIPDSVSTWDYKVIRVGV